LLGGSGVPLLIGAAVRLVFTEAGLDLQHAHEDVTLWHKAFDDLTGAWIGGSGAVTSDAGIARAAGCRARLLASPPGG
jgi:hypothetical protein